MSFDGLGLSPRMLDAVAQMRYTQPTPIQQKAIPEVLAGRDIVGCAQTGTGKTAAFVLPVMQLLTGRGGNGERPHVRALIITPTRELAVQIDEVANDVAEHAGLSVAVVYGGVGYEKQMKQLKRGVDVVVATPGRLLDMQGRKLVDLSRTEILVIDEADRMLDMGFWPDVRKIVGMLPRKRQNLLFSATMSPEVLRVIGSTLDDPVRVDVAPTATPVEKIEQKVFPVAAMQKTNLLVHLIESMDLQRVLVFTGTKQRADRVHAALVSDGIAAEVIHSDRRQKARESAVEGFRDGSTRVLVATDVMARGIDIEGISHVVNYDMPETVEDYVHRIGRTARAGSEGTAISLISPQEASLLRDIEGRIGCVIPCEDLPGFDYHSDRIVPRAERGTDQSRNVAFGGRVMGRKRGGRGIRRR